MFTVKNCRFGRGLFATENIPKGTILISISGPIITQAEVDKRTDQEAANALQIGEDLYIDFQEPGVLINHSCNPNTGVYKDKELITLKKISKGEEITWDYSTSVDTAWTMPCHCEEKQCRKKVRDFESLSKEIQERYLKENIVLSYIAKRFQ